MAAVIIDGKQTAAELRARIAKECTALRRSGVLPGLCVVVVGDDPASAVYVRNKHRACEEAGIYSEIISLPADTTQQALCTLIRQLNEAPQIHGILVQLPLPPQINPSAVIAVIDPRKDVDCFHAQNVGLLYLGTPRFFPCTPAGVIALLDEYGIAIAGKECVVLGRSNIVGKPLAAMLLARDGTVSICHSKTQGLHRICARADILISAVGHAGFVRGDMIKPGAAVIDIGINRGADGKLCGDVVFSEALARAGYLTPVPGGVGPMTIAMLLQNTLTAAKLLSGAF